MRKRNLWVKKAGALLTAAAITASLCVPNVLAEEPQQTAQEQTAAEAETGAEQQAETPDAQTDQEEPQNSVAAQEAGTDQQDPDTVTDPQKDETADQTETEEEKAQDQTAGNGTETAEAKRASVKAEAAKESDENSTASENGQYDTTKPVIEKVEFPQQGQTLTTKDTLKFYIYAYDADSGINYVSAEAFFETGNSGLYSTSLTFEYNEAEQRYEGTLDLGDVNADSGYITRIQAVDYAGNYVTWKSTPDGSTEEMYTFSLQKDAVDYTVKNFVLEQQGETLKSEDVISVSFETDPVMEEDPGNIIVRFKNTENNSTIGFWANLDDETGKYEGSTQFNDLAGGKWVLDQIGFSRIGELAAFQMDHPENYWFNIEKSEEVVNDKEAPVITSIDVDKNGEVVQAGDTVTITIKAADNVGMDENNCYAYMAADQDIVTDTSYIDLQYDKTSDSWIGTFEVDENTYPCEWYLEYVYMRDLAGNTADVTKYRDDFYTVDPYYVQVVNKDTFVNTTYKGKITFTALDEEGYWETVSSVEKENVEKRATFKEAGIEIPTADHSFKGAKQTGWVDSYGNPVDENTLVTEQISYMSVYAKYDKTPVNISRNYLNQDGEPAYDSGEMYFFRRTVHTEI